MNESDFNYKQLFIPVILLIFMIAGGIFYFQNDNTSAEISISDESEKTKIKDPIVLGDADPRDDSLVENTDLIKSADRYIAEIEKVRKPINDVMEDILEKIKYPNLFSHEEVLKLVDEADQNIASGITEIENLEIATKYESTNESHIESLKLLTEALGALKETYKTGDKKQSELFTYKINQSNKIVSEIKIPN